MFKVFKNSIQTYPVCSSLPYFTVRRSIDTDNYVPQISPLHVIANNETSIFFTHHITYCNSLIVQNINTFMLKH